LHLAAAFLAGFAHHEPQASDLRALKETMRRARGTGLNKNLGDTRWKKHLLIV